MCNPSISEDANGQFETDFTYTDALGMADRLVFFRLMVQSRSPASTAFSPALCPAVGAIVPAAAAHYNMSLADREPGRTVFDPANA